LSLITPTRKKEKKEKEKKKLFAIGKGGQERPTQTGPGPNKGLPAGTLSFTGPTILLQGLFGLEIAVNTHRTGKGQGGKLPSAYLLFVILSEPKYQPVEAI
jgi:hypothetical protein